MYCEKLSEQLTAVDNAAAVSATTGTTTVTGTAIDGSNYNRLIALSRVTGVTAATGTWQIQWQASVVSGFTGTATTVQTCTGGITGGTAAAVTAVQHCEIAGEDVQSARAANDRYVRAVLTLTSGSAACTANLLVLANAKRYHPS